MVAIAIACLYFYAINSYWAPAHPGVDQNGYQVGGKLFAQTLSSGFKPVNDFTYIGWMWVRTPDGWYYPKYPLGLPVLDAICLWAGSALHGDGVAWAYLVSPLSSVASLVAMFFMVRLAAGSFAGLLAMILLASCPVTLVLANNPNSHPPCTAFCIWGMLCLIWWWRYGGWWRGVIAGFLLGYALTIRYTEGLLLLPLSAVALMTIRWRNPRSYLRAAVPLFAWLVPVLLLVLFNRFAMGSWTGYDTTNESTGFTWKNFVEKWEQTLNSLHGTALFFVMPLGVLGLGLLYRRSWRLALVMTLWFLPGVLLYTSYYWGSERMGLAYLRFFVTLLPPMIFCAAWLLNAAGQSVLAPARAVSAATFQLRGPARVRSGPPGGRAIAGPIAAGVVVAIASAVSMYDNVGALERDFAVETNLADIGSHIKTRLPGETDPSRRPILFGDQRQLLNYIQFAGNYECYAFDVFSQRFGQRMSGNIDPDAPNPLQLARREYLRDVVYKNKTDADLINEGRRIMNTALASGRRVYVALPASFMAMFRGRMLNSSYEATVVDKWREPVEMTESGKKAMANLGFGAAFILGRGVPMDWQIVEIKRKK